MKTYFVLLLLSVGQLLFSQNLPPTISNLQTSLDGNQIIIDFDLEDNEGDLVQIDFRAGAIGSTALNLVTTNASGDLGDGINPGTGKQIVWNWSEYADLGPNFRIMLTADDLIEVNIQSIVDAVDSLSLKSYLSQLVGTRHRTANPDHLAYVQDMILEVFQENKLETSVQTFDYGAYEAKNIIGRLIGSEEETAVYILDGHYDSEPNTPGADDNGSAVAGVLEALRVLSPYSFRKSIKFIGFDLEETGLTGSSFYVQNPLSDDENLEGVLNFEMIGYASNEPNSQTVPFGFNFLFPDAIAQLEENNYRGDFITVVSDGPSTFLSDAYIRAIDSYVPQLNYLRLDILVPPSNVPDLSRSDHASFWAANERAIMLTDGANFRNPNYHSPGDSIETLDFTFMTGVVKASVAALAELAEIRHATSTWLDTDFSTSVQDHNRCNFKVGPNPGSTMLTVNNGDCSHGPASITILDSKGSTVYTSTLQELEELNIDVSAWSKGTYFVQYQSAKQELVEQILLQ